MKRWNKWEMVFWVVCAVLLFYITVIVPVLMVIYGTPLVP